MLRQCNGFHKELSLYIPESLLVQRLVFKKPVVLYVSGHNRGAAQAAQELCSLFTEISVTNRLDTVGMNVQGPAPRTPL
eukprot:6384205-Prymnesium_polylepis.1